MKTLMKMLRPVETGKVATERFSFHVKEGVEIYEHESVRRYATAGQASGEELPREPRLIVEPGRAPLRFISKARSEIKGLTSLLKTAAAIR